jgi:tRNA G10  N-methylase Trm11
MQDCAINLANLSIEKQRPPERYTQKSRKHPAKMYVPIARWCIERYTKPSDWVLDVMAGIGTVPVEAAWLERNAIGLEYESEWYNEMHKNLEKVPQGKRRWTNAYLGDAKYAGTIIDEGEPFNLIMFSPPYGPLLTSKKHDEGVHAVKLLQKVREEADVWPVPKEVLYEAAKKWRADPPEGKYSKDPDNVGNLNKHEYELAMLDIYHECLHMVEAQGHMVLVTRNPCKDWAQVPLDMMTIDMCQQVGWVFKERWESPIYRYSFWINKYKQKCEAKGLYDVVPKHDDVLVFELP